MGKTYKAARAEQKKEPIVFTIEDEEFSIERPLPGFILLDFSDLSEAEGIEAVQAFAAFYRDVLTPADYKRFRKCCAKYRVPLKADMDDASDVGENELSLLAIAQDIIAEDTGRPTQQRSDSQDLPQETGTSSDIAV